MEKYDVIIIGKGPAGISTALYTVRANLKTLVIGTETSSLKKSSKIENYYGFAEPVSGQHLLDAGVSQASRLGATISNDEVTSVEFGDPFTVKTVGGDFCAKAILIATGQAPHRPDFLGVKEFEGKGVSYCTTCDGFFYKNKTVGILGSGNYAVQEALELEPFTKDITIFTNGVSSNFTGDYVKTAEKYKINNEHVSGLFGDAVLREIKLESVNLKLDGLFIASGTASSTDFAIKLGVSVKENSVIVDSHQMTNLQGVFAAGDCTGGFKQISTAVGQGAVAGKSMIEYVRHH